METYHPPALPTLIEANENPAPLKTLPKRWKKNALITAGLGILCASMLTGCSAPLYDCVELPPLPAAVSTSDGLDLTMRLHGGGSGSASYIVHITEEEAFNFIRMRLEAAGLNFGFQPPDYTTQGSGWGPYIGLSLFDCPRHVAIAYISWADSNMAFSETGRRFAESVARGFEEQTDLNIGVIFNPGFFTGLGSSEAWDLEEPTDEETAAAKAEARPVLEERLNEQIDALIAQLRNNGIID